MKIVETLKLWIDSITPGKFEKVWEEEGNKGNKLYWDAIKVVAIATVIAILISLIGSIGTSSSVIAIILGLSIIFILDVIFFIINQYLLGFFAGLFNKNKEPNSFDNQSYLMALVVAGITLVRTIILLLEVVIEWIIPINPMLDTIMHTVIDVSFLLFGIYLTYKVIKKVYKLSTKDSLITIGLYVLIWIIFIVAIMIALYILFWSVFANGAMLQQNL